MTRIFAPFLLLFTILAGLLSACNLPKPTQPSGDFAVATEVSRILTQTAESSSVLPTLVFPHTAFTSTPVVLASITPSIPVAPITPNAYPTSPVGAFDPQTTFGPATATDSMDKSKLFLSTNDPGHYQADFANGVFSLTSFDPDGWHSWVLSYVKLEDFYLSASFTNSTCAGSDRAGFLVRSPDPSQGYLFGITCDGQFSLRKWDGSGFSNLLDWQSSDVIRTGSDKTNLLGILARGDHFSLYVNGSLVGEAQDQTYTQGVFGLFQAASETANYTVSIDDLSYWILE